MSPPSGPRVSDELDAWLRGDGPKTLGGLTDVFGKRAFAIVFVVLLGVPALPAPTGGVTHVFEVVPVLLALELVAGRETVWLPRRLCAPAAAIGRRLLPGSAPALSLPPPCAVTPFFVLLLPPLPAYRA